MNKTLLMLNALHNKREGGKSGEGGTERAGGESGDGEESSEGGGGDEVDAVDPRRKKE